MPNNSKKGLQSFWDAHPCGAQGDLLAAQQQRYNNEPWIAFELQNIPPNKGDYLEIGCGQGVDTIFLSSHLSPNSTLLSVDVSKHSLQKAQSNFRSSALFVEPSVVPHFKEMDALNLDLPDKSMDYVYSMGCLHHTGDTRKAVSEIHRVLRPGGECKVFLYRTMSIKILVAKCLRAFQRLISNFCSTDKPIYEALMADESRFVSNSHYFGTMFAECFGVPVLDSFTKRQINKLFKDFSVVKVSPYGTNFRPMNKSRTKAAHNPLGNFFLIEGRK